MPDLVTTKELVSSIEISQDLKQRLAQVVDILPSRTQLQLRSRLLVNDMNLNAVAQQFVKWALAWREMVEGHSTIAMAKLFPQILGDPDSDFGRMAWPFVLDVHEYLIDNKVQDQSLNSHIYEIYKQLLKYGSYADWQFILGKCVWQLEQGGIAVLPKIRQSYLFWNPEYDYGVWVEGLAQALLDNQEQVSVNSADQSSSALSTWLHDYLGSSSTSGQQGAFGAIQFLNKSDLAKQLNESSRQSLVKIFGLYDWLSDPYVTKEDALELGLVDEAVASSDIESQVVEHTDEPVTLEQETGLKEKVLAPVALDSELKKGFVPTQSQSSAKPIPPNLPVSAWENLPVPKPKDEGPVLKRTVPVKVQPYKSKLNVDEKLKNLRDRMQGKKV